MSQQDKQLAEDIWAIAHRGEGKGKRFSTVSGKVVAGSINMDAYTCSVVLSTDDDDSEPLPDVMLNAVTMNGLGLLLLPDDDSDVWVSEIDGEGKYGIVKCSTIKQLLVTAGSSKMKMEDDQVQFNDGGNGGVPIVGKVKDNFTALKSYIKDTLEPAIKEAFTAVGVGSAASGPSGNTSFTAATTGTIEIEDMENTKVKH